MLEETIKDSSRLVADALDKLNNTIMRLVDAAEAQGALAAPVAKKADKKSTPENRTDVRTEPAAEAPVVETSTPEVLTPEPAAAPAAEPTLTHDDLRALGKAVIAKHGSEFFKGMIDAQTGHKRIPDVTPDQFEKLAAALRNAVI